MMIKLLLGIGLGLLIMRRQASASDYDSDLEEFVSTWGPEEWDMFDSGQIDIIKFPDGHYEIEYNW